MNKFTAATLLATKTILSKPTLVRQTTRTFMRRNNLCAANSLTKDS